MPTYRFNDGQAFEATTPESLFEQARASAHVPTPSLESYCEGLAERAKQLTGAACSAWPPSALLADLIHARLIVKE